MGPRRRLLAVHGRPKPPAISRVWYHNALHWPPSEGCQPTGSMSDSCPGCAAGSYTHAGLFREDEWASTGPNPRPYVNTWNSPQWTRKGIPLDHVFTWHATYYGINTNVIVSPATARSSPFPPTWCLVAARAIPRAVACLKEMTCCTMFAFARTGPWWPVFLRPDQPMRIVASGKR
jgi:hypothetical protein